MWIEQIEFGGFGNIAGEKIDFVSDKLNLVVESNEYGKTTIAEAVWAILFDFPPDRPSAERLTDRAARKPRAALIPYRASMNVTVDKRQLRIERDFMNGQVKVKDRARQNADITAEFMGIGPDGLPQEQVGLKLTGMSRDLFRSTCFVGQRQLDEHHMGKDADLGAILQRIADSSSADTTGGTSSATEVLTDMINHYPWNGKNMKIDQVVGELETQYNDLLYRVKDLEDERVAMTEAFKRLDELSSQIVDETEKSNSDKYLDLCIEAFDIEDRVAHVGPRIERMRQLIQEREQLQVVDGFPLELAKQVEDLWTRRNTRKGDFDRVNAEMAAKGGDWKSAVEQAKERYPGLDQMNNDDHQAIMVAALNLRTVEAELEDLRKRREGESKRLLGDQNLDMGKLEEAKKALATLDMKDVEDARLYTALISSAKEQLADSDKALTTARVQLRVVNDARKKFAARNRLIAIGCAVAFVLLLVLIFVLKLGLIVGIFDGIVFLAAVVFGVLSIKPQLYKLQEGGALEAEYEKQTTLTAELNKKILALQGRLNTLASKAGIVGGGDLIQKVQEMSQMSTKMKDLDVLDHQAVAKQSTVQKLKMELGPYFHKAGRLGAEINYESAVTLADELKRYLEEAQNMSSTFRQAKLAQQQLEFLSTEIRDVDGALYNIFAQAQLPEPQNIEASYELFNRSVEGQRRWHSSEMELKRIEYELSMDGESQEAPNADVIMEKLKAAKLETWTKMQAMITQFPELSELDPSRSPTARQKVQELREKRSGGEKFNQDEMKRMRDELVIKIRTSAGNFDQQYFPAVEELETVSRKLNAIKQAKLALELARDTLGKLSTKTYSDWSVALNALAAQMIANLGLDYESLSFGSDLKISVKRKGDHAVMGSQQIMSQFSIGVKEQVHWLARMIVCRYVARDKIIPIILDEPFSECDDERFVKMMRFVMSTLCNTNQVIIFSCHQQRHQWLMSQLGEAEKQSLIFCKRTPLHAKVDA